MNRFNEQRIPLLSKSRFTAGLQCHKRLYLECYSRELADEVTEQQQAIFDSGTDVGALARDLYPGGVLISEDHFDHEGAVVSTRAALSLATVLPLYEAAFLCDGVRMRADILVPVGDGQFDLVEVKSTSKVKDEHLFDAGIQLYVLHGSGISVRRACLCHVNTDYVYEGGAYRLGRLFRVVDISNECSALQPEIPSLLAEMRLALAGPDPPDVRPGRHCTRPYTCQFYGHCHMNEPEHHVSHLPRARDDLLESLAADGIEDIRDIPPGFPGMNVLQRRVRDSVMMNRLYLDSTLKRELQQLNHPIHFLDFETFNPALPLYRGTRPYQVIPFQWSLHTLDEDGILHHREFLHDGNDDPRPAFAESLLTALGDTGPIIVYSSFEAARIGELADALPAFSAGLEALLDGRLEDLLLLVRAHCYHPEFHGSFSIKSVLPALVPHLGYDDLAINDGTLASMAYAEMLHPETSPERRAEIRGNLLAYCERDTLAEVELFRFFTR
jgi:CRISPR/Cas system-associated exonuclease Cas4 (RecB family)